MLENFHLKSRFYHEKSQSPEVDPDKLVPNILESRKTTGSPKPKIKISNSSKFHQPRQIFVDSIPTNMTNADESFRDIKKIIKHRSSKQSEKTFLNDSCLTDSVKKTSFSTEKRSVKRSENSSRIRPSSRLKTPYFRKIQCNDTEKLQALCERLLLEQEAMKKTIKKQEKLLFKLEVSDTSTPKNKPSLPKIFRFDFSTLASLTKAKERRTGITGFNSPVEYTSKTSLNSPTYGIQDIENSSLVKPEDISASRISTKFHKDQPKLCSSLRFPMEIFTPK